MKVLIDPSKLRESYLRVYNPKTEDEPVPIQPKKNKPSPIPPQKGTKKKKRIVRRGINKGKYGRPRSFTHEQDMAILDMKRSGFTYKQMGDEMGRNSESIRSRYYKLRDRGYVCSEQTDG